MTWMHRRLVPALACSLLLHALPFAADFIEPPPRPRLPPTIEARLLPPPPALEPPPPLSLPEPPPPARAKPAKVPSKPEKPPLPGRGPAKPLEGQAWEKAMRQLSQRLLYPEEAIARGLEGEALVRLVLNEAGNVVAARIEESSGHAILDEAALRAVRSLKSLPAEAPREALLPVRFRLR